MPRPTAASPPQDPTALARAEARLAERTRELDLLQELGRKAAEAPDLAGLFDAAVEALGRGIDLDATLAVWPEPSGPRARGHFARPWGAAARAALEGVAFGFLDTDVAAAVREEGRLSCWDDLAAARERLGEDEPVLVPVPGRGRPPGCLVVVAAEDVDEPRLRLVSTAGNLLALHYDRIVTVREAEDDRFRAIVEAMPQGVLLTDPALRVLKRNRAAARIADDLGHADDFAGLLGRLGAEAAVAEVQSGARATVELEVAPGGAHDDRSYMLTVSSTKGARGAVGALLFVVTDQTERRRLAARLSQSEKMSSLGQMISGVAHELNNPLASILGFTQLLRLKGDDERLAERLDILATEAERCRKIVSNLLSFARQRPPARSPVAVTQIVQKVVGLLAYQMRIDDVAVATDVAADLPVLWVEEHQLEQALVNLLTNARHAIVERGGPGRIDIVASRSEDGGVALRVRDDGPGIPQALRARIFDPFFTTKAHGRGTGLGLALVFSFVETHGGAIDVRAPAAGGTEFRIVLPEGRPAPQEGPAAPETSEPVKPIRGARVLVVEDEPAVARLVRECLLEEGHRPLEAAGGEAALAALREEPFDLVVSGVHMPGLGGLDLYDAIRREHPRLAGRVVLITGDTLEDGTTRRARAAGIDVLTKPFDLAELNAAVRRRLEP